MRSKTTEFLKFRHFDLANELTQQNQRGKIKNITTIPIISNFRMTEFFLRLDSFLEFLQVIKNILKICT